MQMRRHPERSEGPCQPKLELGRSRSLAALGMTVVSRPSDVARPMVTGVAPQAAALAATLESLAVALPAAPFALDPIAMPLQPLAPTLQAPAFMPTMVLVTRMPCL